MATYIKRKTGILCQIRRKGHKSISRTFDSKAEAERWALSIESKIGRGTYEDTREAFNTTLSDCLDRYESEITPLKKGASPEKYRIAIWRRDPLALRPIGSIRPVDIARWRDKRLKEVSPSTVRMDLALLSHVYTIAFKEWSIPVINPVSGIRKPQAANGRDRRLSPSEEKKILANIRHPEMRVVIILAIETAMRRGELLNMRWEWIKGKVVALPDTKNGTARKVPLSTRALAALSELPRNIDGRVFTITDSSATDRFEYCCRCLGIEDLHFHDLRHTATSRFFEMGLSIMEVQAITGHKTMQMLLRYTHLDVNDLAEKLG